MSNVIYVVTAGEYSDYHIVAATTSKEHAENIAKTYESNFDPYACYGEARIEQFEDSQWNPIPLWDVWFRWDGSCTSACAEYSTGKETVEIRETNNIPGAYNVDVTVRAKDKETAIKAAAERRAKALAEKEGL